MKKFGFTLIELLVVISIISLLASAVFTSVNSARSKARFSRALLDMNQITRAAELYFDSNGDYHPDVVGDTGGAMVPAYLSVWPRPPCNNWVYDWENWASYPGGRVVRVTLRKPNGAVFPGVYYFCIERPAVNCGETTDVATDIRNVASKVLTCNE